MKIKLIDIGHPTPGRAWTNWAHGGRFAMPSCGLVSVASLSRPHDEVEIIDEKVEGPVDPDTLEADVFGLSFKSMYAERAYAVADRLRARGKKVVLGGVHATNVPREAAQHADVVCVGEGEPLWRPVLDDIEAGTAKSVYRAPMSPRVPLDTLPRQRFELLKNDRYLVHSMQSARGCSFDCEFCPTRLMFGSTYRQRNIDCIVAEVEHLLRLDDKPVFFTENVFGAGDLRYAEELTGRLHAMGATFGCIVDWVMVRPELMRVLAKNGCTLVCINLTGQRGKDELASVRAISDAGMAIWGYIMFGFEEDKPDVFQGAIETVNEFGIVCASLTVLAPYPGTPMGKRLDKEHRITSRDISLYDQCNVVFKPAQMSQEQLQQGYDYVVSELGGRLDFIHAVRAIKSGRSASSTERALVGAAGAA
jgi:radical SAM superfamily enzyme YgiQ (UPF0313 family)